MDFAERMRRMTAAACAGDGAGVAACFTEDGVYHDVFYGAFAGRARITEMIEGYFHRDGSAFRWDLFDPMCEGGHGYVRYVFSYQSKLPEAAGRRATFEGVAVVRLEGELIAEYREVANAATGLAMLGLAPERISRFLERQAEALSGRPEAAGHGSG